MRWMWRVKWPSAMKSATMAWVIAGVAAAKKVRVTRSQAATWVGGTTR